MAYGLLTMLSPSPVEGSRFREHPLSRAPRGAALPGLHDPLMQGRRPARFWPAAHAVSACECSHPIVWNLQVSHPMQVIQLSRSFARFASRVCMILHGPPSPPICRRTPRCLRQVTQRICSFVYIAASDLKTVVSGFMLLGDCLRRCLCILHHWMRTRRTWMTSWFVRDEYVPQNQSRLHIHEHSTMYPMSNNIDPSMHRTCDWNVWTTGTVGRYKAEIASLYPLDPPAEKKLRQTCMYQRAHKQFAMHIVNSCSL